MGLAFPAFFGTIIDGKIAPMSDEVSKSDRSFDRTVTTGSGHTGSEPLDTHIVSGREAITTEVSD